MIYEILKSFETKFSHLKKKGLRVDGLAITDPKRKTHVIKVTRPLIFDNRELPRIYQGMIVKTNISGDLPKEFAIDRTKEDWHKREYIWAPERFEKFVERCSGEIKTKLDNPKMTKSEMLDALCFGNFKEHKVKCDQLIKEGKLPAYHKN